MRQKKNDPIKTFTRITVDVEDSLLAMIEQERAKQNNRPFLDCLNEALYDWYIKHEKKALQEKEEAKQIRTFLEFQARMARPGAVL